MAITNEFKEAVQAHKTILVRIMLKDSLLVDPTAAQFDEMERYAMGQIEDLYTEHDGETLNFNESSWDENYLNQQMVAVVNSFSKERIRLLKSMVRVLYKEKVDTIINEPRRSQSQGSFPRKSVGAGMTVVGAGMTVAGICTVQVPLMVVGGVVAAVGIGLIVSDVMGDRRDS